MQPPSGVPDRGRSLVELARQAVAGDHPAGWSIQVDGPWCLVGMCGHVLRRQGWKLHVSATPNSAAAVLDRTLSVLVTHRCVFKFAADLDWAAWLNSARCPRGTAGKFLTAYPDDDERFGRLAEALHRATAGMAGPRILSDRRYRADSIVYYRFGAFTNEAMLDDDGCYRPIIVDPTGHPIEDRREAWYSPPGWAVPALADQPPVAVTGQVGSVLLGGRFALRRAVRHSSRGGVFLGSDRLTGLPVLVKQARALMEVDPSGRDCRDRLRHEAELLSTLAAQGLAPRPIAVIEETEDVFLARSTVDGCTLRDWVAGHRRSGGVPLTLGLAVARSLVRLVDQAHRAGLVLVDVSSTNIVMDHSDRPWLTDLDHAAHVDEVIYPAGTTGYVPPEHEAHCAVPARPEADLFGLGGLLFLLAVGGDPIILADDPPGRPVQDRVRAWLATGSELPLVARLADAVVGLMRERPSTRWRARRVLRFLGETGLRPVRVPDRPRRVALVRQVDQLIEDGVAHLVAQVTPGGARLWPTGHFGASTDPCAVQHGAAGVLAALVRAAPWVGDPAPVRQAVELAAEWIEARLPAEPRLLPGLYFGRSGTAWALHDAAVMLGDRRLAAAAIDLAARIPVEWPNPDVAHGAAGAGMAVLRLWRASEDTRLAAGLRRGMRGLLATASNGGATVSWPIPATLRSTLAGRTFYGYAHGAAGIGDLLLTAGSVTGSRECLRTARAAADTLVAAARQRDGVAYWPTGPDNDAPGGTGWCKGSAGIATFLLRAWRLLGEPRYLELARAAGQAVYESRLCATTAACHGLAGGGQYLLDLADAVGESTYRDQAWELARVIATRSARCGARLLVPDETGRHIVADYGVGFAGVLDFLVRLRHGGPRPWTAEPDTR